MFDSVDDRVFVVPSHQIDEAWPIIQEICARVEGRAWSLEDLYCDLSEARAQAWGVRTDDEVRCILVTRVENTFSRRYGVLWIAAGSGIIDGMRLFREYIEPWFFDDQDCEWIEIQGRRGWARLLQDYNESAVVLTKHRPTSKVH